jgi:ABC-type lipoprotein export system ATPase subunit
MTLFQARSLCKYYRAGSRAEVRALDDVSLELERGSLTVVTGASGSGKTTLLALLAGLERPTRGEVVFDGRSLRDCSDAELARVRRRVGFVFQDFALIPNLTVGENITYPLIPRGVPRAERQRRARELLARLGIEDKLATPARDLSGGERQRVAVARALAGQPEALLADEPTSNLDPDTAAVLLDLLRERHVAGTTLVLSSHDPRVIALATQVHELTGGRLSGCVRGGAA